MGCYVDANGNYYEGDRQGQDQSVPQRLNWWQKWSGSAWIDDAEAVARRDQAVSHIILLENAKADALFEQAKTFTLSDINNFVNNNFGSLTVAQRNYLKILGAAALAYLREK